MNPQQKNNQITKQNHNENRQRIQKQQSDYTAIQQINNLNKDIQTNGKQRIGLLGGWCQNPIQEINNLVQRLEQATKMIKDLERHIKTCDDQIQKLSVAKEKLQVVLEKSNYDKEVLRQKLKMLEKDHEQIIQKMKRQNQQLTKGTNQLKSRYVQLQADFRKKEIIINNLQQSIIKFQGKRTQFVNNFELFKAVQKGKQKVKYIQLQFNQHCIDKSLKQQMKYKDQMLVGLLDHVQQLQSIFDKKVNKNCKIQEINKNSYWALINTPNRQKYISRILNSIKKMQQYLSKEIPDSTQYSNNKLQRQNQQHTHKIINCLKKVNSAQYTLLDQVLKNNQNKTVKVSQGLKPSQQNNNYYLTVRKFEQQFHKFQKLKMLSQSTIKDTYNIMANYIRKPQMNR